MNGQGRQRQRFRFPSGPNGGAVLVSCDTVDLTVGSDEDEYGDAAAKRRRDHRGGISVVVKRARPVPFETAPAKRWLDPAEGIRVLQPVWDWGELHRPATEAADNESDQTKRLDDRRLSRVVGSDDDCQSAEWN